MKNLLELPLTIVAVADVDTEDEAEEDNGDVTEFEKMGDGRRTWMTKRIRRWRSLKAIVTFACLCQERMRKINEANYSRDKFVCLF